MTSASANAIDIENDSDASLVDLVVYHQFTNLWDKSHPMNKDIFARLDS